MFCACCGNRFPLPNGRLKIKRECCGGWGGRFFLDGQYSDDEYFSAISLITPTKENDLCLRVIKKRKTIYMVFCICMQYKCLRIQFVIMWYFIILNVFCKELISRVEIVPCTCYSSRCYSNIRVSPMQNEGVFCCYCSGRDDGFGENGGDLLIDSRELLKIGDTQHYVTAAQPKFTILI